MNEEYVQEEPVTEVTENTDAQSAEEVEEGIELTDTTSNEEEKEEVKTYTEEDLEKIVNERINSILPNKIERERRKIDKKREKGRPPKRNTPMWVGGGRGAHPM